MNVHRLSCASCGASLSIPDDVEQLSCTYCGTFQTVQRGEGYIALKIAETVARTIEDVGSRTTSSIREGTDVTRTELKRLQLGQELSSARTGLAGIQAEIRMLERGNLDRAARRQLTDLRAHEHSLIQRINGLSAALSPAGSMDSEIVPEFTAAHPLFTTAGAGKDQLVALVLCLLFGWLGVHRFYTGHILIGVVQFLTLGGFGIWWLLDLVLIGLGSYRDVHDQPLRAANGNLGRGCLFGVLTFVATSVLCGGIASVIDGALFDISSDTSETGPLTRLALLVALMLGITVVILIANTRLWHAVKSRFRKS